MSARIPSIVICVCLSVASVAGQECEIPDYPNAENAAELGLPWCPSDVSLQVRAFALQAAGAQCAITTGSSSTPGQIQARRQEIRTACEILAGLGVSSCQCPPGLQSTTPDSAPRASEPSSAGSLSPEMLLDKYLLEAEMLTGEKDHAGALEAMERVQALQQENGLTLPETFPFQFAQTAMAAGSFQAAIDAVNQYLSAAGREGEHYREALGVLVKSERGLREPAAIRAADKPPGADLEPERRMQAPVSFQGEPKCTGQTEEASCWMELSNQAECYVWNPYPQPDETVTWTGGCVEGAAQGAGTLKWVYDGGQKTSAGTGRLQAGQFHGRWVSRDADGGTQEGSYVAGKLHGNSVHRGADGTVAEGPYEAGNRHGHWIVRFASGNTNEGPYVEGEQHGRWVARDKSGRVIAEGHFVNGEGEWIEK